jgi:hypothetical protein
MNIGVSAFGAEPILQPNASNLPEVLNILQGNKARFERYNQHIRTVFPHIHHVAVRPLGSQVEIVLWTLDPDTEREDLTVPLTQSGTGVGQVLAILYVAMTAPSPQVILVDEPQSFLHPGAVRKLIEILKVHYPMHQYILTTHSPSVITDAESGSLLLVRRGPEYSSVTGISRSDTDEMRQVLTDVGARLSDVFGADNIVWVEGPTEERCFPLILTRVAHTPLLGTVMLGVDNTGDFETKKAGQSVRAFNLYERLSSGTALLPPALAFIFDREDRTQKELEDMSRRGKGKVQFLPRRLYENYLLDAEAIANLTSKISGFRDAPVSTAEVVSWLENHRTDQKYWPTGESFSGQSGNNWYVHVHGAKLLADLFAELSEQRVLYQKTQHSVQLTEWLIENKPEALEEVSALLKGVVTMRFELS